MSTLFMAYGSQLGSCSLIIVLPLPPTLLALAMCPCIDT